MLIRGWIQPWAPDAMPALVSDWLPAVDTIMSKIRADAASH